MTRGTRVRDVLNELRWHPERDSLKARIFYRHRGVEEGFAVISGDEVEQLGSSSFTFGGSTIPYYKVFRITYEDEVLFEREETL
ncbi:MAG: DUF504 domain-containing protein [Thermoplasmata archaeon]